jgi:hypothetical protein
MMANDLASLPPYSNAPRSPLFAAAMMHDSRREWANWCCCKLLAVVARSQESGNRAPPKKTKPYAFGYRSSESKSTSLRTMFWLTGRPLRCQHAKTLHIPLHKLSMSRGDEAFDLRVADSSERRRRLIEVFEAPCQVLAERPALIRWVSRLTNEIHQ